MNLSSYKAFLFDVDKTLTNSKKEISPRTKEVIQMLQDRQFHVGICTGRQFVTLKNLLHTLFPADSLHIVSGGGQIVQANGTVVRSWNIPAEIAIQLSKLATEHHARFLFQANNELFGNQEAIEHAQNYFLPDNSFTVPKLLSEVSDWGSCGLITIGNISDEFIAEVQKLPIPIKIMTNYSGKKYIDVTAPGVNKGTGVTEWCAMLQIQEAEVIGFGDSENDIEFLNTVGYSVAMGNATTNVQAIADDMTTDCDHDGVAEWIRRNV